MTTLPAELVGDATKSTHHWDLLKDLVDINNRMSGQKGEAEGAELIVEAFEKNGLQEVNVTEFEVPGWWRGSSSLSVEFDDRKHVFDADYQTLALPGTPSGNLNTELVDIGYGRPEDFKEVDCEGKIAMVSSKTPSDYGRWIHRSEKYGFAVNHGAEAFIFRNHVEGCLPPTGSIENPMSGSIEDSPIQAVGVSKEIGDRLIRYCSNENVNARLLIDCRKEPAVSRNVEGVIGPDTNQEVLITGHIDGHDISESANDNGVGSVLATEVGRLLAQTEDDLETKVRCLIFGSEEIGLLGSHHWIKTHPNEQVKCILNMDGIGYSRNLGVDTHRFNRLGEIFEEVAKEYSTSIEISDEINPNSDHWPFVQKGIPSASAYSISKESGRGWGHTHADTLDKLDIRDLRSLSLLMTAAAIKTAKDDLELNMKSVDEIREAAIEDNLKEGLKNYGWWPFNDED